MINQVNLKQNHDFHMLYFYCLIKIYTLVWFLQFQSLDFYLMYHSPTSFPADLLQQLKISPDPGSHYSISLINAIVLYIGKHFVASNVRMTNYFFTREFYTNSSHMNLFKFLSAAMCNQGTIKQNKWRYKNKQYRL